MNNYFVSKDVAVEVAVVDIKVPSICVWSVTMVARGHEYYRYKSVRFCAKSIWMKEFRRRSPMVSIFVAYGYTTLSKLNFLALSKKRESKYSLCTCLQNITQTLRNLGEFESNYVNNCIYGPGLHKRSKFSLISFHVFIKLCKHKYFLLLNHGFTINVYTYGQHNTVFK